MRFQGATLFDGTNLLPDVSLQVNTSGMVESITEPNASGSADTSHHRSFDPDESRVELDGGYLIPGFVDLQVNGGGGVMLNDEPSVPILRSIAEAHLSLGTTAFLPTLITDQPEKVLKAVDAVEQAIAERVPGIAGLHLEGPHISAAKKGAHPQQFIRKMTADDLNLLRAARERLPVLKVTVAPESVTTQQVEQLSAAGVVISLGHSNAGSAECLALFNAGASCATHLFNAMSQLGSREPGLVGAALDAETVACGLIADGIHVDYTGVRLAVRMKSPRRLLYLVSDAMAVAGSELDQFSLLGETVRRSQGRLTLADGTLAGADLSMGQALQNIIRHGGVTLTEALCMTTSVPAGLASLQCGSLLTGSPANMIWLDRGFQVRRIWYQGVEQRCRVI